MPLFQHSNFIALVLIFLFILKANYSHEDNWERWEALVCLHPCSISLYNKWLVIVDLNVGSSARSWYLLRSTLIDLLGSTAIAPSHPTPTHPPTHPKYHPSSRAKFCQLRRDRLWSEYLPSCLIWLGVHSIQISYFNPALPTIAVTNLPRPSAYKPSWMVSGLQTTLVVTLTTMGSAAWCRMSSAFYTQPWRKRSPIQVNTRALSISKSLSFHWKVHLQNFYPVFVCCRFPNR